MSRRGPYDLERPSRIQAFTDRFFPDRQLVVRTEGKVAYFKLSKAWQLAFTMAFVMVVSWGTFTSVSFVLHDRVLVQKDNEIAGARLAYRSLLNEVATYQNKFASITRDLEENHSLMLGLVEKNAQLQRNLSSVSKRLEITAAEREKVTDARERLKEQLAALENEMQSVSGRNFALNDNLTAVESDLHIVMSERNKAQVDSSKMRHRVDELTDRLQELQNTEGEVIQRMNERAGTQIADLEQVITLAGLNPDRLLGVSADEKNAGVGGPFIPLRPDGLPASDLKTELTSLDHNLNRLEALQTSITRVPLVAPMPTYYITSSYGKRRDPITKRWSAHYGVDLGGRMNSKVYSTAAGEVTFAGWKGRYGKLIEIDHGFGLKTRFGHLNKIRVKTGETIKFNQYIGNLGNTGRSTGPHLHYEVVFNGKPMNPLKFIRAGKYVFKDK